MRIIPPNCTSNPRRAVQYFLTSLSILGLTTVGAGAAPPVTHHPGKWTGTMNWPHIAVHMVLMRGDSTAANILWWRGDEPYDNPNFSGSLWRWTVPVDDSVNSGTFPISHFIPRGLPKPYIDVFCGSHSHLADGRILIAGGNDIGEVGLKRTVIFNPESLATPWQNQPDMSYRRWYPTNTVLSTGKTAILSGSQFQHLDLLGGVYSNGQVGDSLRRYGLAIDGNWDPPVYPLNAPGNLRPAAFEGLTMVEGSGTGAYEVIYGGRRYASGQYQYSDTLWFMYKGDNPDGDDNEYSWQVRSQSTSPDKPVRRAFHTAVKLESGAMLLLGGIEKSDVGVESVSSQVWYGKLNGAGVWSWNRVMAATSDSLGPRYGARAVYDPTLKRIFVFGGASTLGGNPTDAEVWSMSADSLLPRKFTRWIRTTVASSPRPGARVQHSLSMDTPRPKNGTEGTKYRAFLFGGRATWNGAPHSDTLWVAWFKDSAHVEWQRPVTQGAGPSKRAAHAATGFRTNLLLVAGGETLSSPADSALMTAETSCTVCDNDTVNWTQAAYMYSGRVGHEVSWYAASYFARAPEVFDPGTGATGSLTAYNSSKRLQDWYPQMFLLPSSFGTSRLFTTGPELDSHLLDLSAGTPTWAAYPAGGASATGFIGGSAVQYRPAKFLKSGSRDTENWSQYATDSAASIDLTEGSPTWKWSLNDMAKRRVNENLVLLPSGEVLVTGGTEWIDNGANTKPVRRPEIWNPDYTDGGSPGKRGWWYGGNAGETQLDTSLATRGYHNTALLLPDARVLCAGGNDDPAFQMKADLYSPPYLFNANGTSAHRPVINQAPTRVRYGEQFSVCVQSDTVNVSKIVFMKAGAVTHGFDQDQHFVPLEFALSETVTDKRFTVVGPVDSAIAPPGDYMLFVLNNQNTPSIAKWVRIGTLNGDTVHPERITSLQKVCSHGDWVELQWNPPAQDSGGVCVGRVEKYEMRYKTSSMSSWSSFQAGDLVSSMTDPGDPGSGYPDQISITSLSPNTHYYFRLISKDYASGSTNWSAMSNELNFITHYEDCGEYFSGGGEGGEGMIAGRAPGATSIQRTASAAGGFIENTLLANAPSGAGVKDRVHLPFGPQWSEGRARVQLSRLGERSTRVDQVRLLAVDHEQGDEAFASPSVIVSGSRVAPAQVAHSDGRDLTAELEGGQPFEGREGDTVAVRFADATSRALVLRTSRAHLVLAPDSTGILVQVRDVEAWRTLSRINPRELESSELVPAAAGTDYRLIFLGEHRLHGVTRVTTRDGESTTAFAPVSATHSENGQVVSMLGGEGVPLSGGETMLVDFEPTAAPEGLSRDWFLEVTGEHSQPSEAGAGLMRRERVDADRPLRFALKQNRPNPFGATTTISFEVPRDADVQIEVFDLLGRRIATLASGHFAPGQHTIQWDRRTQSGTKAAAGVYLYRMRAPGFREQRQLVVFP